MSSVRITPIGTCRIHTPLKSGAARYPIQLELGRNFGFVHTSEEALQLTRFLQGDKTFRPEVAPLVFRGGDIERADSEQWRPADLHIVEVSSAKLIRSGTESVQANYIGHHFADFFASRERFQKFWALARKGDRRELLEYIRPLPSFQRLSGADRQLLASLSVEQQSSKSLRSDMAEIAERLGRDKVLFVTHVGAVTPDGGRIPKRDRLIRLVKLVAEELGVPVFDPTELMRQFGQEHALENAGLDLTHYTPEFSDAVYDAMHGPYIGPLLGDEAAVAAFADPGEAAAARLRRLLDEGDFETAAREINLAAQEQPDSMVLAHLRGIARARVGDYAGAAEDLSQGDETTLSHPMRSVLMEAQFHSGREADALRIAENLLGDEYESATIYAIASKSAEKLGQMDRAAAYAKQAFRQDRDDLASALRALKLVTAHGTAEDAAEWRGEILESISGTSTGGFEICLWAVENRDDQMFAAALQVIGASDKAACIDLLEAAAQAGMVRAVADSIGLLEALGRLERNLAKRRIELLRWAVEVTGWLLEQGRALEAYHAAKALAELQDSDNSQLRTTRFGREAALLTRSVERQVRRSIREAFARGDRDGAIRIGLEAMEILTNDPDSSMLVVRSLHTAERVSEALDLVKGVLAAHPDHFSSRRWAGRLGALSNDHATALEMYAGLDRSDPQYKLVQPEVDRYFASAEPRALRELRQLIDSDRFDEALQLADAIRRHLGWGDRQEREITRMYRSLRARLREIEETTGDLEDREPILRYMTAMRPDDTVALRRLALEFMRQFRFAEAADCWERLNAISPDNETAVRNQKRCRILAARKSGAAVAEVAV